MKITSAVAPFPDVKSAIQTAVEIMQTGLPIARIEFLDSKTIRGCNQYSKTSLDEKPTLFLEFHGSDKNVQQQADVICNLFIFFFKFMHFYNIVYAI